MERNDVWDVQDRRKFSLKAVLLLACLLSTFVGGYLYYAYANPVSPNIALDDIFATATYLLKTDTVNYWALLNNGSIVSESTTATTVLQYALDALASTGGKIVIDGHWPISAANINIPQFSSDLIIEGCGHKGYLSSWGTNPGRTWLEFTGGRRITSSLVAFNTGRLIIRHLALTFTGLSSQTMIDLDYIYPVLEDLIIQESGNTYSSSNYNQGVIAGSTSTVAGINAVFSNLFIDLHSNYVVAFYLHYEPVIMDKIYISFGYTGQKGIVLDNPGTGSHGYHFNDIATWWGSYAEGCWLFVPVNSQKNALIDFVSVATQSGAGDTTGNAIFGNRSSWSSSSSKQPITINYLAGTDATTDMQWGPVAGDKVWLVSNSVLMPFISVKSFNNEPTTRLGTATISSSTSVTFDHDLASTPIFVDASFDSTAITGWKWNASSTQITITVTPTGTYTTYWSATVSY